MGSSGPGADDDLVELVVDAIRDRARDFAGVITAETSIRDDGLDLDSIGCLELLVDIEARTGLALLDESLTADALATVGSLTRYVTSSAAR